MKLAGLILSCSLLALIPAAAAAQPAPAPSAAAQASAHDRLFQLFKDSDEASLRRNPLQALYRGDQRYADRLGDLFSDAHYQAEKAAAEQRPCGASHDSARPAERDRQDRLRCVREPDRGDPERLRAGPAGDHRSAADEPFLRAPHAISDHRRRAGGGAVPDGRGLRQQSEAQPRLRRQRRRGDSRNGRRARRKASSTPSSPSAT